jgi:hypothetical protein
MSLDFSTDLRAPRETVESPCLCAQMCEAWGRMYHGGASDEIRAELAREADSGCPHCRGTGIEMVPVESPHSLNTNLYGYSMLRALGLPAEQSGECTIAEARRGLLRARNTDLGHLVEEEETTYGRPCADENGAIQLRPLRSHTRGLSLEDLDRRLNDFSAFVEGAAEAGATQIFWS